MRVQCLGLGIQGLGVWFRGLGFRGLGFRGFRDRRLQGCVVELSEGSRAGETFGGAAQLLGVSRLSGLRVRVL